MASVISSSTASRILRRTQALTMHSTPPMLVPASRLSTPPMPVPSPEPESRVVAVRIAEPTVSTPPIPPRPQRVQIVDHPAAQHALTMLCSKHTSQYAVRSASNHLLVLLTLEAMRSLPTRPVKVETTRAAWHGVDLAKPVVLLSVSRDGLSLSHNLRECVPGLLVGSVTLHHAGDHHAPQARLHLPSAPALRDSRVLLFDPVIRSGTSAGIALDLVRHLGATDISLLSFSISAQGLLRLQSASNDLNVWTAHVDSDWDAKRSPIGALDDLGTRLFA